MLAHFAGDMRKHIALPRKIDTKHRARQHLRHRAFGHDLVFLWHALNILLTGASLNQRGQSVILLVLLKRNSRQVFAEFLTFPPCASLPMFFCRCESITIQDRADVARWLIWKWVMRKQPSDIRLCLEQTNCEPDKPGILLWSSQRGEPHLPIESRLMWRAPAGRASYVTGFPFEFVRQPIDAICAAFDHNLAAILGHYAKKPVAIHDPEWFEVFVSKREPARPLCVRSKCIENEPCIDWQRNDDHHDRAVHRQSITVAAVCNRRIFSTERCVIYQQQTERDRKQIEEKSSIQRQSAAGAAAPR